MGLVLEQGQPLAAQLQLVVFVVEVVEELEVHYLAVVVDCRVVVEVVNCVAYLAYHLSRQNRPLRRHRLLVCF